MKPNENQNTEEDYANSNVTEAKTPESVINPITQPDINSHITPTKLIRRSHNKAIIVSVIVLILVLAVGGAYVGYNSKHKAKPTASVATTKSTKASTTSTQPMSYGGVAVFNNKGTISLVDSSGTTIKSISLASTFGSNPIKDTFNNLLSTSTGLLLHGDAAGTWGIIDQSGTYQALSSSVGSILSSYNDSTNPGVLVDGQNVFTAKDGYYSTKPYTYDSVNLNSGRVTPIVTITPLQKLSVFQPYSINPNGRDIVALLYEVSIGSTKVMSTPAIAEINIKTGKLDKLTEFPPVVASVNSNLCSPNDGCNGKPVGLSPDGNLIASCDSGVATPSCNLSIYNLTTQKDTQLSVPADFYPGPGPPSPWLFSPNNQYIAIYGNGSYMYIFSTSTGAMIKSYDVGNSNYNNIQTIGWLNDNTLGYEVLTTTNPGEFLNQPTFHTINVKNLQISNYPRSVGSFAGILPATP